VTPDKARSRRNSQLASSRSSNESRRSGYSLTSRKSSSNFLKAKQYDESEEAVQQLVEKTLKYGNEHAVHVEWLGRIQALWEALKKQRSYNEYKRLQNSLREKRKQLEKVKEEVEFEGMQL